MSTTEELIEIIKRVHAATESLSRDDLRLREIAFERLLDHELSHTAADNGHDARQIESNSTQDAVDTSFATPDMRADAIGRYFQIDPEEAMDIFDLSGDEPTLAIPSNKIPAPKAGAVRQIALLIGGARTALGLETDTADVRKEADNFGKVDPNFMGTLTDFDKIVVRGKKGSKNRLIRMRVIGAEEAQKIAQELVSNGE